MPSWTSTKPSEHGFRRGDAAPLEGNAFPSGLIRAARPLRAGTPRNAPAPHRPPQTDCDALGSSSFLLRHLGLPHKLSPPPQPQVCEPGSFPVSTPLRCVKTGLPVRVDEVKRRSNQPSFIESTDEPTRGGIKRNLFDARPLFHLIPPRVGKTGGRCFSFGKTVSCSSVDCGYATRLPKRAQCWPREPRIERVACFMRVENRCCFLTRV